MTGKQQPKSAIICGGSPSDRAGLRDWIEREYAADETAKASMTATQQPSVTQADRKNLSHYEQMLDAQAQCVPCKLCGSKAVIQDAGAGAGYHISCAGLKTFRTSTGCMLGGQRIGGWAYNASDWWNRLHHREASTAELRAENERLREALPKNIGRLTLGEGLSKDHYCGGSHEMSDGQPVYWEERGGEYPDDIDGYCLTCAIGRAESDAGWCECSITAALSTQTSAEGGE